MSETFFDQEPEAPQPVEPPSPAGLLLRIIVQVVVGIITATVIEGVILYVTLNLIAGLDLPFRVIAGVALLLALVSNNIAQKAKSA